MLVFFRSMNYPALAMSIQGIIRSFFMPNDFKTYLCVLARVSIY